MSYILLVEQTAPATPSTNQAVIYVKSDGKFYTKDDTGTESLVSHANPVAVSEGGTGAATFTAYAVLCGGTTATAAFQPIASVGSSGQILTSNGAGALPTFQAAGTSASQANMETATDTTVFSSPGRQHFHPGHPKAWVKFNVSGTVAASYNITSVTDVGTGDWTVVIATDFSSANYCGVAFGGKSTNNLIYNLEAAAGAGSFEISAENTVGTNTDPSVDEIYAAFFGDQA